MTVPQAPSIWTVGAYGVIAPNMIGGIATSTRKHYVEILSTTRKNQIHSMDSQKPFRPNFRKGGMKKVLEEEIAAKSNYVTTAGIRVGESFGAKASFWSEVLEKLKKTDSNEIRSTAEGIREATGWECPVDKNSVYVLCQLHEVYVDEKRRRTDDTVGPSKIPESWNSEGKAK